MNYKRNKRKGMTLIELLAVIAIIAILFILLIPQINSAIYKARQSGTQVDLRDYLTGMQSYFMEETGKKNIQKLNSYLDKENAFVSEGGKYVSKKNPFGNKYELTTDWETYMRVISSDDDKPAQKTGVCVEQSEDTNFELETCFIGFYKDGKKDDFDDEAPQIAFSVDGNDTPANSHSTVVTVTDNGEIKQSKYAWSKSSDIPEDGWADFTSGDTITSPENAYEEFYLHVKAKDNQKNATFAVSKAFNLKDEAPPTIEFSKNSSLITESLDDLHITAEDLGSGLDKLYYAWSTSTTAPADNAFVEIGSGETIDIKGLNGTKYLFAKAIDKVGNTATKTSGKFVIDGTPPVVSLSTNGVTSYTQNYSTVLTVTDAGVGVKSIQYVWSNSTTVPISGFKDVTSGTTLTTPSSEDYFYLHVIAIDKNGNTSNFISKKFDLFPYVVEKLSDGYQLRTYLGSSANIKLPTSLQGEPVVETHPDFLNRSSATSVEVPGNIKRLNGFYGMTKLEKVVIHDGVESLGGFGSTILRGTFVIPGSVKTISTNAFIYSDASELEKIVFEEGLEKIEGSVFMGANLTNQKIVFPNSLKSVGVNSFRDTGLEEVTLGEDFNNLGIYAFTSSKLAKVTNNSKTYKLSKSNFSSYASGFVLTNTYLD